MQKKSIKIIVDFDESIFLHALDTAEGTPKIFQLQHFAKKLARLIQ